MCDGHANENGPANSHWRGRFLLLQAFALLGVRCLLTVRQAVDVSGQQVNLVVALQLFLRRHLALTAVTDGLLQLSKARTVDERSRVSQVRCAHRWRTFAFRTVANRA